MPLKANIGLTRKLTDNNYGSRGGSVNLEIELDTALLNDPAKLHQKVRQVFDLVRTSLEQEIHGDGPPPVDDGASSATGPTVPNATNRHSGVMSPNRGARIATANQIKALRAIARTHKIDLPDYLHRIFRVDQPEHLTLKQASVAIDELKSMPTGAVA